MPIILDEITCVFSCARYPFSKRVRPERRFWGDRQSGQVPLVNKKEKKIEKNPQSKTVIGRVRPLSQCDAREHTAPYLYLHCTVRIRFLG